MDSTEPRADLWERRLLATVIHHNSWIHEARARLRATDFYSEGHQKLFSFLARLSEANKPFDFQTISESLVKSGKVDSIGGIQTLFGIQESPFDRGQFSRYCDEILSASRHRRLITLLQRKLNEATSEESDPNRIIGELQQETLSLIHSEIQESTAGTVARVVEKAREIRSGKRESGGISTSIPALDSLTSGLKPAEYIVAAGRTGDGKSSLSRQIASYAAKNGHTPLICSPEMTRENIVECLASSISEVPYDLVQHPQFMTNEQWANFSTACEFIGKLPLQVDDTSGVEVGELCSRIRARIMRGVDLVIIDYLQLIRVRGAESDYDRVTKASAAFRDLAKITRVPILALSQLRRTGKETTERPTIYELKESGNIENDAFQVWLIYRPRENGKYTGKDEIIVGKNRNGPCDTIPVFCRAPIFRFEERHI